MGYKLLLRASCVSISSLSIGGLVLLAVPMAHAQVVNNQKLIKALDEAKNARTEAQEALEKANKAISAVEALINQQFPPPQQATNVTYDEDKCASGETGSLILDGRNLRNDSKSSVEFNPEYNGGLNWYALHCLKMTNYKDYKDTTDLSVQFTGANDSGVIAIGPSFTQRKLTTFKPDGSGKQYHRTSYRTLKLGGFAGVGDDGNAAAFDLDSFEFKSGVGIKAGIEFGWGALKEVSTSKDTATDAIAQARRDCIAHHRVIDPVNKAGLNELSEPLFSAISNQCKGANFLKWLSDDKRKHDHWKKIIRPLWGYDNEPVWFVGAEGSYAWADTSYYPLYDTATSSLLNPIDPVEFLDKEGATPSPQEPFSVKVYGGFTHKFGSTVLKDGSVGAALALTYRREFSFPDEFRDQQICVIPDGGTFNQCRKVNVAAPYEKNGFVGSLALKFQLPKYAFLPPIALTVKPSYAFDTKRWGVEVPVYLFSGADDKLSSGIKFSCREKEQTDLGFEIKGKCDAALFVGTKFKVAGAP